jgi:tetratricopeptide (TPR) repeat protein
VKRTALAPLILIPLLLVVFSGQLKDRLALNLAALDTVHFVYTGRPFLAEHPAWLGQSQSCAAHWMAAQQAKAQGKLEERDQAFQQAVACEPLYVVFLHHMYPDDLSIAQIALIYQPASAESWFWAGDLNPDKKIEYYQQGLSIDPKDGRRWIVLGDLINNSDPEAGLQAYLQGCHNGDPGFNGCGRAGSVAERLGLYNEAIYYYRLSSYPPFRQQADILESKLTPTP